MSIFDSFPALATLGAVWCVLVLKMLIVGLWTSGARLRHRRLATPEDTALVPGSSTERHPDVERARRAHRNDLECVLPFFGVALMFAFTRPPATVTSVYFWGFAAARILHSVFYLRATQPHRTIAFTVAWLLLLSMVFHTWARLP